MTGWGALLRLEPFTRAPEVAPVAAAGNASVARPSMGNAKRR